MANDENLIPMSERSKSEARELGKRGGIASGKARRERREMRDALEELLAREYDSGNGKVDGTMALMTKTFQMAIGGDLRAVEFIRDTVGQKPVERVETVEISPEVYERVERALEE